MSLFLRMLQDLPFSSGELQLLLLTAPTRYKTHEIAKRRGGTRVISQPTSEVKMLQRWAVSTAVVDWPLHDAATAYRRGASIVRHARPHAANKYLLKLDFKDFFPSLKFSDLNAHAEKYLPQYTEHDLWILRQILFKRDRKDDDYRLSIGAPSSPAVSNSLMFDFDLGATEICRERGALYTRYADDLAFSSSIPNALNNLHSDIRLLCQSVAYPRLEFNSAKTVNVSKKFNRTLTGLTLANEGRVSIGHDRRRQLRAMIDHFARGKLSAQEVERLKGLLSFARSVDPTVLDLVYRRLDSNQVTALLRSPPTNNGAPTI
ncbi:MAG: reverse transcriptase family protein [Betaproteobacteria bacterium]|nr:reverse transcriptase family protein [Betaproteobacteria bacterium]